MPIQGTPPRSTCRDLIMLSIEALRIGGAIVVMVEGAEVGMESVYAPVGGPHPDHPRSVLVNRVDLVLCDAARVKRVVP